MRLLFGSLVALMHLMSLSHVGAQDEQSETPLPVSPEGVQPALVGSMLPSVGLRTAAGEAVDLVEARAGKPSVLIIYRGGW